jgi:hypothetical protein
MFLRHCETITLLFVAVVAVASFTTTPNDQQLQKPRMAANPSGSLVAAAATVATAAATATVIHSNAPHASPSGMPEEDTADPRGDEDDEDAGGLLAVPYTASTTNKTRGKGPSRQPDSSISAMASAHTLFHSLGLYGFHPFKDELNGVLDRRSELVEAELAAADKTFKRDLEKSILRDRHCVSQEYEPTFDQVSLATVRGPTIPPDEEKEFISLNSRPVPGTPPGRPLHRHRLPRPHQPASERHRRFRAAPQPKLSRDPRP